jgi:hypothetical protein
MNIFEKVEHAKQVWILMLSGKAAPDDHTLARWMSQYTIDEMGFAIGRTATKCTRCPEKDALDLRDYCGGIVRNERIAPQRRTS